MMHPPVPADAVWFDIRVLLYLPLTLVFKMFSI